jgi:chromosome segregation ATPase
MTTELRAEITAQLEAIEQQEAEAWKAIKAFEQETASIAARKNALEKVWHSVYAKKTALQTMLDAEQKTVERPVCEKFPANTGNEALP